jgi:polyisoprenoid-binding protein YceI
MSTATAPEVTTAAWNIDPAHSSAQFKVKHMMISNVKGEFAGIKGSLQLDNGDVTNSRIEATIDVATIDTRDAQRDTHLKSADFFDVAKFPTLTFKSGRISKKADGELAVAGDLTIHGVTRPVVFEVDGPSAPAKDPWGSTRIGLTATTRINRKDFGLTWNTALETGGVLVGEEVAMTLEVEFIKA